MFPKDINFSISINYIKQNTNSVLKEISNSISINETEYIDSDNSNISKDILNKAKEDAKKLRYEIQINNQEIYKVYTYIRLTSVNKEKLFILAEELKNKLITKTLKINTLNFRHLIGFLSTSPFCYSSKFLSNYFVNMTTQNLKNLFPFYTETIIEKDGILFGKTKNDNKLCIIDLFNRNHLNYNMCIFGSSGSGKSYFTKLLILRNYIKNIKQYIIDPEGEYINIPGTIFDLNKDKLNILQIFEKDIKKDFLSNKIEKTANFICNICDMKDYQEVIEKCLYITYLNFGITDNLDSMYIKENQLSLNNKFKTNEFFPSIDNFIENLENYNNIGKTIKNNIIKKLKSIFNSEYKFLNGITNIDLTSEIIVFDISNIKLENRKYISKFLLDYITDDLKNNEKSLIYIDEVWRLVHDDDELLIKIFDLYKTVRKRNAGIVTITQDVSDMFSKNNGSYGKSIFNNSSIKLFFKTDYNESNILKDIGIMEEAEYEKLLNLKKGEVSMYFLNSTIELEIEANSYEKLVVEGETK